MTRLNHKTIIRGLSVSITQGNSVQLSFHLNKKFKIINVIFFCNKAKIYLTDKLLTT